MKEEKSQAKESSQKSKRSIVVEGTYRTYDGGVKPYKTQLDIPEKKIFFENTRHALKRLGFVDLMKKRFNDLKNVRETHVTEYIGFDDLKEFQILKKNDPEKMSFEELSDYIYEQGMDAPRLDASKKTLSGIDVDKFEGNVIALRRAVDLYNGSPNKLEAYQNSFSDSNAFLALND